MTWLSVSVVVRICEWPRTSMTTRGGRRDSDGPSPARRLGRRGRRPVRPLRVAGRSAADRARGSPAPRRAAADHRLRRAPDHRVRYQYQPQAAGRPRAAAPPPGPRRAPHPLRERQRADQPGAARLRPEPDLVRHRRPRRRPRGLDADPRPDRARRPAVGPSASGYGCSPSPDVSPEPADGPGCTWPDRPRSPAWPWAASAGSTLRPPPPERARCTRWPFLAFTACRPLTSTCVRHRGVVDPARFELALSRLAPGRSSADGNRPNSPPGRSSSCRAWKEE